MRAGVIHCVYIFSFLGRQISYDHLIPTTARIYSLVDKDEGARWYHQYQDEFKSYYHNVFSNKVARKLLF
jgi:hypothetical protein